MKNTHTVRGGRHKLKVLGQMAYGSGQQQFFPSFSSICSNNTMIHQHSCLVRWLHLQLPVSSCKKHMEESRGKISKEERKPVHFVTLIFLQQLLKTSCSSCCPLPSTQISKQKGPKSYFCACCYLCIETQVEAFRKLKLSCISTVTSTVKSDVALNAFLDAFSFKVVLLLVLKIEISTERSRNHYFAIVFFVFSSFSIIYQTLNIYYLCLRSRTD